MKPYPLAALNHFTTPFSLTTFSCSIPGEPGRYLPKPRLLSHVILLLATSNNGIVTGGSRWPWNRSGGCPSRPDRPAWHTAFALFLTASSADRVSSSGGTTYAGRNSHANTWIFNSCRIGR